MSVEIRVPQMAESLTEATILRWMKREGDPVAAGEEIVELETDKANNAISSEVAGVVERIVRQEGETVVVNDLLAVVAEGAPSGNGKQAAAAAPAPARAESKPAAPTESGPPVKATPMASVVAGDKGVDLTRVAGSGPGGKVTRADVEQAVQQSAAAPAPVTPTEPAPRPAPQATPPRPAASPAAAAATTGDRREEIVPMSKKRQIIAVRLKEAQNTAAMLTTFNEVDMTAIMELRKRRNEAFEKRNGIKLGFMSFFTRAAIGALKAFPYLNAEIRGTDIILKHYFDIGIAVGASDGLVVPVVRDADRKTFAEIEKEIKSLAERARDNKLGIAELLGGTFTLTNGGIFGSLLSTPILNTPQVGILGMHKIEERPIALNGEVVIRPMMYLALSYDHRIVDGSEAVRFLVRIKELVEDPEALLLEG